MESSLQLPSGMATSLSVIDQHTSLGAVADLEHAITMLHAARAGQLGPSLRFYIPQPTVAFGQRDTRLPGFEAAREACFDHGFAPMVRRAGGRAAAYHQGCLVLDHIEPHSDAITGSKQRFSFFSELLAAALRSAGVNAGVGEIPGEYCPGEYTVHGLRTPGYIDTGLKLVGTAQRVVSGAWLFSSSIVVADSEPLRAVLTDVYAALDLDWNTETAGAAEDLVPGLSLDMVKAATLSAYAEYAELRPGKFERETETAANPPQ